MNALVVKRTMFFMLIVFILTACSTNTEETATPGEILTKVEEAHDGIESVFINEEVVEHLDDTLSYVATEEIDFTNGIISYGMKEANILVYKDNEGIIIMVDGERADVDPRNEDVQDFKFIYELENQKNPIKQLKEFDENFYESLTMKENKGSYTFTYNGNDEQKHALIQGIVWSNHIQANALADTYEKLDIADADLEITALIDKKTSRIQLFEIFIKYSPPEEFNTQSVEFTTINKYSKYNEVDAIEKPEVAASDTETDTNTEEVTMSDEEAAQAEQEASDYVDALIQATVFQDVEKYVSKAPGPQTEEEKREDGSMQQSFFREIYKQNTMENMKDSGVTEEQVTEFAAAFMKALSATTYEMADSKMVDDDTIQVTLSIRGFDNTQMNLDVEKTLIEEHEAGKIEDEDLLNRNLELIIEAYNSNDGLLDTREAVVDVIRSDEGTYTILLQDQYLLTFVQ